MRSRTVRATGLRLMMAAIVLVAATVPTRAQDARVGLKAGLQDAASAAGNLELVSHLPRPDAFFNPTAPGDFLFMNSDMAFKGDTLFLGNFRGFQVYDISDPASPRLLTTKLCPGGQGDLSVYGNLLFMSVEMPNGRTDCGTEGSMAPTADAQRFRGVRIFDITDISKPVQVAAVQTCRGSHTHTLVTDPRDRKNVYIYVSGVSVVRPAEELAGCSGKSPEEDPNTSYFRIEIIRVPLAAPQDAKIVNAPRIFADTATGKIAGLYPGGTHGEGTQETARTDQCHDITVYSEIGLAAGACSGNGILLNISDPANPVRIHEVTDPNFAYFHSATFNNDGSKVIFTDEWGGGMAPRCQATDKREWGADAIFDLADRKLKHAAYYKLPAPQTATENCVAHNGSLIPVPGRDIMVQAWYQGGVSVFDFTDSLHPVEIAYFDRGPYSATESLLGGFWSAYWYNGNIYGSEIGRGLDIFKLKPSEYLTQNEIDAANLARVDLFNPQNQARLVWPASYVVAHAYLDQLKRGSEISSARLTPISAELIRVERMAQGASKRAALTRLAARVTQLKNQKASTETADARRIALLAQTLKDMAKTR